MKALLYTGPHRFEYTDVPDPEPGPRDVRVRVKACGICGSDVQGATGETGRRIPPLIMGHEAAGVVEGTGREVTSFESGDRVCFDSTVYCNECPACKQGLYNRCDARQVLGVSTPDFKRHGAMAEYVTVPVWIVEPLPDSMTFVQAALLEPVSIAAHAANRAAFNQEETVAVMGAGTIGLLVLQTARLKGATHVISIDVDDSRLQVAAALGADRTLNPTERDVVEQVTSEMDADGVDVSFEVVGLEETFRNAMAMTQTGGQLVAIGNVRETVGINLQKLVSRELTFRGSYASAGEFRIAVDLVASGRVNVKPLISDVMPLSRGARAFERLQKAEEDLIKIVLTP